MLHKIIGYATAPDRPATGSHPSLEIMTALRAGNPLPYLDAFISCADERRASEFLVTLTLDMMDDPYWHDPKAREAASDSFIIFLNRQEVNQHTMQILSAWHSLFPWECSRELGDHGGLRQFRKPAIALFATQFANAAYGSAIRAKLLESLLLIDPEETRTVLGALDPGIFPDGMVPQLLESNFFTRSALGFRIRMMRALYALEPEGVVQFMQKALSPFLTLGETPRWSAYERLMEWDVLAEDTTIAARTSEFANRVSREGLREARSNALAWIGNLKESLFALLALSVEIGLRTEDEAMADFKSPETAARNVAQLMKKDPLINAFAFSPRTLFATKEAYAAAAEDGTPYVLALLHGGALPIGRYQTNSQPSLVYRIASFLDIQSGHRVLDGGGGTGQAASIFSHLVGGTGEVVTVERQPDLHWHARAVVHHLLWRDNVQFILGNVLEKIHELGGFDRIFIAATAPEVPEELVRALRPGGRMVIPVQLTHPLDDHPLASAMLKLFVKDSDGNVEITDLTPCGFVPLIARG